MGTPKETRPQGAASQGGKRKYEPPAIQSQQVFETTALACGKRSGQGGVCNFKPKAS
jgi:hypothetical protein